MTAVKLTNFIGIAPRISPELLPDNAAQIAHNVKLYSGDIIPYKESSRAGDTYRRAEIRTLYALRDDNDSPVWLSWPSIVNVVEANSEFDGEQRFYYTGDGVPKVSTFALATRGVAPYPTQYYTLGLPLPTTRLSAVATSTPAVAITSRSRDAGNYATITTASPHNLRTGNIISVTGMPAATASAATFNVTNATATVINDTTLTYFSPGEVASGGAGGTVSLAGNTFSRTYVYTWYTPWAEESIPSDPSDAIFLKEGQTVTITGLPVASPTSDSYIRGVRVYRTVNSTSAAAYMRLATLWFPAPLVSCWRTDNILYIRTVDPHFLIAGDKFCISGTQDGTYDIASGEVYTVVDKYIFAVEQSGADYDEVVLSNGKLYHDCAPIGEDPRFWGLSSTTFTDDYDVDKLSDSLDSEENDPPPEDLQGLILYTQGIYCGFVGNQVFFSEKDKPYAWPASCVLTMDERIVALAVSGVYLVVLTEGYPYVISGSNPKTMSYSRVDFPYPCLSAQSVVQMGYGIAYATHGGIAVYNPSSGAARVTQYIHSFDTWEKSLDPSTIVAAYYEDMYIAAHSAGGFSFDRDPDTQYSRMTGKGNTLGGTMVSLDLRMTASWIDQKNGKLYYTQDDTGLVYLWDDSLQPSLPTEWKSKVIVTKEYLNLGAARVIADYASDEEKEAVIRFNQSVTEYNAIYWDLVDQVACINGPTPFAMADGTLMFPSGTFNAFPINGDPIFQVYRNESALFPCTFRLWRDKELIFQADVGNNAIFRLPAGFRTDTIEFSVSGNTRVRAIHIGETPYGLREA